MTFRYVKRRPPFVTLPRHKRREAVIRLNGAMCRNAGRFGGRFDSSLALDDPGRPDLYKQSFHFYFPGTQRFTIWNANVVTARKAFWQKAHDIAYNRVAGMLNTEELEMNFKLQFEAAERSKTGKILSYKLAERHEMRFEQFGGLTFDEQLQKLEAEIVRNEPPVVHESFLLDRSYAYGIGVDIVLDVDVIDQAAIEAAIDRFMAIGEKDWVAHEPVPRDRLPAVSESEALATVQFPP
ncbi:hypothetical protein [Parazoarcus communis]|nr:hypothetical protein [Parazoarcus communis]